MKIVIASLLGLLILTQYTLWFSPGGWLTQNHLRKQIQFQELANNDLQEQNDRLLAEVNALKRGGNAVEERARRDLGMIKKNEVFYQIVQ